MINFNFKPKEKTKLDITYNGEFDLEIDENEVRERMRTEAKEKLVEEVKREILRYAGVPVGEGDSWFPQLEHHYAMFCKILARKIVDNLEGGNND